MRSCRDTALLLSKWVLPPIIVCAVLLVILPGGAHAASSTVIQPITLTLGSPGPVPTLTISGCSASPSQITELGTTQVNMTSSCMFTITNPAPGASSQYVFDGYGTVSTQPIQDESCTSICISSLSITDYLEYEQTLSYTVTGGSPQSPPSATGTQAGSIHSVTLTTSPATYWFDSERITFSTVNGATGERWAPDPGSLAGTSAVTQVVSMYHQFALTGSYSVMGGGSGYSSPNLEATQFSSPYTPALTTAVTPYWLDASTSWSVAPNPLTGSGPNERWGTPASTTTSGTITAPVTFDGIYYNQYSYTLDYSIVGGGGPAPPTLTSSLFGSTYIVSLTTSPTAYWLDAGAPCLPQSQSGGSTPAQRWATQSICPTVNAAQTITFLYYHQYSITASFSIIGGGTPGAPVLTCEAFGSPSSSTLASTPTAYWEDNACSWSITNPIGASSGERWYSGDVTSGVVAASEVEAPVYYNQYLYTLSYSVTGGGSPSPPTVTSLELGASYTTALATSATPYWFDASASCSVTNPIGAGAQDQRWDTPTPCPSAGQSQTIVFDYYHQYLVSFAYTVLGGGSGYSAPSVIFVEGGSANGTDVGANVWADSGSHYNFTDPLPGSSSSERWFAGNGSGAIRGPGTIDAGYYHQYAFLLSYSVVWGTPGVGVEGPVLNYSALGATASWSLPPESSTVWLDSGSRWSVSGLLGGSTSVERWATDQNTSGIATSPYSTAITFYEQYLITVGYTIVGGGSPKPADLSYIAYGTSDDSLLSNGSRSLWVDVDTKWALPGLLPGSNQGERWIANASVTAEVSAPATYGVPYLHQYFLLTASDSTTGGVIINSTDWYGAGVMVGLNASSYSGWKFEYWNGLGPTAYNGTESIHSFALTGPATETAMFYPGVTIVVSSGGDVAYSYGRTSGSVSPGTTVIYVPIGTNMTLKAAPAAFDDIFTGWSGAASGIGLGVSLVAGVPRSVSASFSLDYTDIRASVVAIPIVVVLAVYILVVRRRSPGLP